MTVPAGRYFYRRRGPLFGIGFPLCYWTLVIGAGYAVTRGSMTWQSLVACACCGAIATGYSLYLAICRKDLRFANESPDSREEGAPTHACPGCGVNIDARATKCPVCGQELPRQ